MAIWMEPAGVDFGEEVIGGGIVRAVTIKSTEPVAAVVALGGDPDWSFVDPSGSPAGAPSVPPQGAAIALVKFAPEAAGTRSGVLRATAGEISAEAALVGVGIAVPATQELGATTRFELFVPFAKTELTMGQGATGSVAGNSYDGFSVRTQGNILLSADGSDPSGGTSTLWAEASGDLVTESITSGVYHVAKKDFIGVGVNGASLVGGGGVFIGAGVAADPAAADGETLPAASTAFASLGEASLAASIGFGCMDTLLASAVMMRGFVELSDISWSGEPWNKRLKTALGLCGLASTASCVAVGIAAAANTADAMRGADDRVNVTLPGVTIYGEAGVLAGTPAFCSVYGVAGLVLGSLYPFVCGLDTEIFGMNSATLRARRDATVQAHKKASLRSSKKVHVAGAEEVKIEAGDPSGALHFHRITLAPEQAQLLSHHGSEITANANGIVVQHPDAVRVSAERVVVQAPSSDTLFLSGPTRSTELQVAPRRIGLHQSDGSDGPDDLVEVGERGINIRHAGRIDLLTKRGYIIGDAKRILLG